MTSVRAYSTAALVLALSLQATARAATVSDDFSSSANGWTHVGDNTVAPAFNATGGNPGGYITITDPGIGANEYFVAPSNYAGSYTAATLSFDILPQFAADVGDNDVLLSGGGKTLAYLFPTQPTAGAWIHYSLPISTADTNWHLNTISGNAPSAADFSTLLGALSSIEILADYHSGAEIVGLDNVSLVTAATPEPASLALLLAAALPLLTRRRVS